MKKQSLILLVWCLILLPILNAQTIDETEVFVRSWKKGNEKITIQTLNVTLTQEMLEFEKEILALSGKKYLISIIKNPAIDRKGEHWGVSLNEINSVEQTKKRSCRELLMELKPCETGGDEIMGAYPGFFYPYEGKKVKLFVGKTHLIESQPFYPVKTERKILVDGFIVSIKSGKIEFDEKDKTKIRLFELTIEFKNTCN
jgi:hypothetical protein